VSYNLEMRKPDMRRFPTIPDQPRPFPTEAPIEATMADLAGWWLSVRCSCGWHVSLPFRFLAATRGWHTKLGAVLPRLRCKRCGNRPESVDLVDSPSAGASGVPGAAQKSLRLV